VLVVTADAARIPAGYRPGVLWTTTAAIAAYGPLEAAWWGSTVRGEAQPLRSALATIVHRPCVPTPGPAAAFPVRGAAVPGLAERARAVRDGTARAGDEGLGLLTFALPPRALDLLALVGAHPLFSAAHLARACPLARSDRGALLALLCRHELLMVWRAPEVAGERRYVLTPRGLRVLALRAGVTPQVYRRLYGVLESSVTAARKGLPLLQRTLAHTDAIHECYLALRQGAEDRGGTLWWRGGLGLSADVPGRRASLHSASRCGRGLQGREGLAVLLSGAGSWDDQPSESGSEAGALLCLSCDDDGDRSAGHTGIGALPASAAPSRGAGRRAGDGTAGCARHDAR